MRYVQYEPDLLDYWLPSGAVFEMYYQDAAVRWPDSLGLEIIRIALPASLALAADPIASLIDTAFIGRLEETIGRVTNGEEPKAENSEKSLAKDSEMKQLKPEEAMLENLEKGASTNTYY
ncbi:hypothetical protein Pint_24011 [Pistacia integerrima]|uniref:Uncharacterized protein n=1 Tax=Pistacia integerrima TaxID=434235 RepID=A0ACC0YHK4_9ROSI|nr:hypothetical protein Pint_24011 [Pistacia integerrima]